MAVAKKKILEVNVAGFHSAFVANDLPFCPQLLGVRGSLLFYMGCATISTSCTYAVPVVTTIWLQQLWTSYLTHHVFISSQTDLRGLEKRGRECFKKCVGSNFHITKQSFIWELESMPLEIIDLDLTNFDSTSVIFKTLYLALNGGGIWALWEISQGFPPPCMNPC